MARKASRKDRLNEVLARLNPSLVDEALRDRLIEELAPVTPRTLRTLLRESGVPLAPLVEGVDQRDLEGLERTLRALGTEYAAGDRARRLACRAIIIEAKDHARWALRGAKIDPARRAEKEEMVLWMLTWLENPEVFPVWAAMRKRALIEGKWNPPE